MTFIDRLRKARFNGSTPRPRPLLASAGLSYELLALILNALDVWSRDVVCRVEPEAFGLLVQAWQMRS